MAIGDAPEKSPLDHIDGDNADMPQPTPDVSGIGLDQLCQEVDKFTVGEISLPLHSIPKHVDLFLNKLESKIEHNERIDSSSSKFGHGSDDVFIFMSAIHQLPKLVKSVSTIRATSSSTTAAQLLNRASSLLHRAMVVLEEEAVLLLEQWKNKSSNSDSNLHSKSVAMRKRLASFKSTNQRQLQDNIVVVGETDSPDPSNQQQQEPSSSETETTTETFPSYTSEEISIMSLISQTMILAGYTTECIDLFETTRRNAFEEELRSQGMVERISLEDVQKMQWDSLEAEIATWIRILKRCSSFLFPCELKFYQSIFDSTSSNGETSSAPAQSAAWKVLYSNHTRNVIQQLVCFAHAVSMTRKSSEKLFKFLDMYETLTELESWINTSPLMQESAETLKFEIYAATTQLGETAVSIFSELQISIKSDDTTKNPVPSGAVHPLIRYTMNYLKYACEYKDTLEQVFQRHLKIEVSDSNSEWKQGKQSSNTTPFAAELITIVDLLSANVDAKSNLYRDTSLRYIFLMNNGRYMLQKIRGSVEIRQAVGDTWYRKKSSEMRGYHKCYQRDTWGKVLKCLAPDQGLQANGKVSKPALKDRFKNFNQSFDEIYRTQSTWVVSDEQLKSELRVSICAVMIPAYRAFLARYGPVFTPGRQYEKYVKYQPDDIESALEDLFEGNPASMSRRRT